MPSVRANRGDESQDPDPKTSLVRATDIRLAAVAAGAWLGALIGFQVARVGSPPIFLVWVGLGISICAVWMFRMRLERSVLFLVPVVICAGLTGAATGWIHFSQLVSDPTNVAAQQGDFVTLQATVSSPATTRSTPWQRGERQVEVDVERIQAHQITANSRVSLRMVVGKNTTVALEHSATALVPGTRLMASGLLRLSDYLSEPEVGYLDATELVVIDRAPLWQLVVDELRQTLRTITTEIAGPVGPLIGGMAIGDDDLLERPLKQAMLTSSLTHLTAVSGTHMAVTLAFLRMLFRGLPRCKTLVTVCFLVLIVAVVGPEPSVMRAAAMSCLGVWGMSRNRPGQPLGLLAGVVLGAVLMFPWLALSIGFALSSIATAAIITLGRRVEQGINRMVRQVRGPRVFLSACGSALAVAISAHFSVLPVLVLINDWLPTWGIIANLLIVPVVSGLTLLGLLAAATCLWVPSLSAVAVVLAKPLAQWLGAVAQWVSQWCLARLPWPQGGWGAVLLLMLMVVPVAVCMVVRQARPRRGSKYRTCLARLAGMADAEP